MRARDIRQNFILAVLLLLLLIVVIRVDSSIWSNLGFVFFNQVLAQDDAPAHPLNSTKYWLEKATNNPSPKASSLVSLGRAYTLQGQADQAISVWRKAPADSVELLLLWGDKYRQQNSQQALDWYGWAVEVAPNRPEVWYRLGLAYERFEEYGKALGTYEQAVALSSPNTVGSSDFLFRLARLNVRRGEDNWNAILTLLDEALARNQFENDYALITTHYLRGEALRQLQRNTEALVEYRWVTARRPEHYWANIHLGMLVWKAEEDLAGAVSHLEKAISLAPERKWGYRNLAEIYLDAGYEDQAADLLGTVLTIDPSDKFAQTMLDQSSTP